VVGYTVSDSFDYPISRNNTALKEINSSTRIPALDGLRGLAILLVLVAHSFTDFYFVHHPGLNQMVRMSRLFWCGVDLFFVLSGFLIGGILLDAKESPDYFKTFYMRRVYRILPLYFLVVVVAYLTFQAGQVGLLQGEWKKLFSGEIPWWPFLTFTQNISMALAGPFIGRNGLNPTWSLAVEEQFYLTLPLIVRFVSKRRLVPIVAGTIAGAALLRLLVALYLPSRMYATYLLTPCRADALGAGVLTAIVVRDRRVWQYLQIHRRWLYAVAGILLVILLRIDLSSFETYSPKLYGAEYSIFAAFFASLLLIAISGSDWFVKTVFCNPALTRLGLIAYATYLFHRATIHIAAVLMGNTPKTAAFFLLSKFLGIVAAVALAQISWIWFEKPLIRRGHRYRYSDVPAPARDSHRDAATGIMTADVTTS
jgi:peptidoglycan/LPS O-acetylase OafA/YrhL